MQVNIVGYNTKEEVAKVLYNIMQNIFIFNDYITDTVCIACLFCFLQIDCITADHYIDVLQGGRLTSKLITFNLKVFHACQ